MTAVLDLDTVATTNPAVNLEKLIEVEKIRRKLDSAGLLRRAEYRLSPPLGTGIVKPAVQPIFVRLTAGS